METVTVPAAPRIQPASPGKVLSFTQTAGWMALGIAVFHFAFLVPLLAPLMILFFYALLRLTDAPSARWAFYPALLLGIACYAPHLAFFWSLFGPVAFSLWTIIAIWIGFFVLLTRGFRNLPLVQQHPGLLIAAVPVFWIGFEYFRCELYWLRFGWLTPGTAIAAFPALGSSLAGLVGSFGAAALCALVAAAVLVLPVKTLLRIALWLIVPLILISILTPSLGKTRARAIRYAEVVGIQLEAASIAQIIHALDAALQQHPNAPLFVLSEYSLSSPPTADIKAWCRRNQKHLVIGGIQPMGTSPAGKNLWADTAFVIDPAGEVVFSQGKSVPIQFFDDGIAAGKQKVWDSPWGKVGICVCYDLSYTRVTDELIRQGAQILIVPTMDAEKWGAYEHSLHARIAPVRAMEYGIPIIRVASSGISQMVRPNGVLAASAPFPGQGATLSAQLLEIRSFRVTHMPLDRHLAPPCVAITALAALALLARRLLHRLRSHSCNALNAGNRGTPPSVNS